MENIASAIITNVRVLSMDVFGCHVVQRALDCVSESTKLAMVQEMLEGIPETIGHRYACHVWQKLLEVRWKIEPQTSCLKSTML